MVAGLYRGAGAAAGKAGVTIRREISLFAATTRAARRSRRPPATAWVVECRDDADGTDAVLGRAPRADDEGGETKRYQPSQSSSRATSRGPPSNWTSGFRVSMLPDHPDAVQSWGALAG